MKNADRGSAGEDCRRERRGKKITGYTTGCPKPGSPSPSPAAAKSLLSESALTSLNPQREEINLLWIYWLALSS